MGLLDSKGNILVDAKYEGISEAGSDLFIVQKDGLMTSPGRIATPPSATGTSFSLNRIRA